MSYSLQPHGLQHARLPCPSPSPGDCSNSCPLSWWYHPFVSSSAVPFSSCLQSFPASGSFLMKTCLMWLCCLHQVAKILELQLQHQSFQWIFRVDFSVDWLDLLAVQGTLKSLPAPQFKASSLQCSAFFMFPVLTFGYQRRAEWFW